MSNKEFYSETQSIKYAGSKLKLLPYILQLAKKTNSKTVFDGFAGSTRVSQAFAQNGYKVISNDRAVWSKILGTCFLLGEDGKKYEKLIDHLNNLSPKHGWFTDNYGGDIGLESRQGKRPWQSHNTKKLDAIRDEIDKLNLSEIDKSVAITSLMLALDKVDSTLGHFVSYLKQWSPRSFNKLKLEIPNVIESNKKHKIYNSDIFNILPDIKTDLAYFDPPYGSNNEKMPASRVRYASYYHIWTTICLNDKPDLFGKVNRRADSSDTISPSPFEDFRRSKNDKFVAVEAIQKMLENSKAKNIILSYSSGGRATSEELHKVINACGELNEVIEINYKKNIMSKMRWTNEWIREAEQPNKEFLFLISKK